GPARQVAVLSGTPPSRAEISCHGGTQRSDALEMSLTPLDKVTSVKFTDWTIRPRAEALPTSSGGPPSLAIWGRLGSVTTEAFASASSTAPVSARLSRSAKKCWPTSTLLVECSQPKVLPSWGRGTLVLPAPGQSGVVTWRMSPLPESSQARMPFEWPQRPVQFAPHFNLGSP